MAKMSAVEKNKKRIKLVKKYQSRRKKLVERACVEPNAV